MDSDKSKLSTNLLNLGFMKRTKTKLEQAACSGSKLNKTEETTSPNSNITYVDSIAQCEGLVDGRWSYGGMNLEIERIMEKERVEMFNAKLQALGMPVPAPEQAQVDSIGPAMAISKAVQRKLDAEEMWKRKTFGKKYIPKD